jgi:hypothetical protein
MHFMNVVAHGLELCCMDYERNKHPTLGIDSRCIGEIWQFGGPLMTV